MPSIDRTFPAPLGPSRPKHSPLSIPRVRLLMAVCGDDDEMYMMYKSGPSRNRHSSNALVADDMWSRYPYINPHLGFASVLSWVDLLDITDNNRGVGEIIHGVDSVPLSMHIGHLPDGFDEDWPVAVQGGPVDWLDPLREGGGGEWAPGDSYLKRGKGNIIFII